MASVSEELLAIRLELKGVREAVSGLHSVDKAQKGLGTTTARTGTEAAKAEKKTSRLSRSFASLGKTARWGLGFLGVGGVLALKAAIDNTEELSKTTTGLARNFGFTTQAASRWAAVAHSRDIDPKALSMSFGVLSSKMVEAARKGGTALTPFHQLGLTQDEVAKGAHNFEWGLHRVADALGEAEGGAKRTTAAKALLGKGFQTLLPVFSEGSKGLKEQEHWADKYGVTLNGKTNDAIMGMVTAQRESKVATLGLQIALTKALMPAIDGGQEKLQEFISILNSDDLSKTQKITHIQKMFENLENELIEVIANALPKVAEGGGKLGVALAGAVWEGFKNSNLIGKLVISAWLFKYMGGGALIKTAGGKAGKAIGLGLMRALFPYLAAELAASGSLSNLIQYRFKSMGKLGGAAFTVGFILGLALIGFLIAEEIDKKTHGAFRQWGINAGQNFVNALIAAVNWGIRQINATMDTANVFSVLGVDAPNIGEVGNVNFHNEGEGVVHAGAGGKAVQKATEHLPPGPFHPGSSGFNPGKGGKPRVQPTVPRINFGNFGGGSQPIIVHNHIELDGKEIAQNTTEHVALRESLA